MKAFMYTVHKLSSRPVRCGECGGCRSKAAAWACEWPDWQDIERVAGPPTTRMGDPMRRGFWQGIVSLRTPFIIEDMNGDCMYFEVYDRVTGEPLFSASSPEFGISCETK